MPGPFAWASARYQRYYESLRGEASGLLSLYLEAVQTSAETELRLYEEAEKAPPRKRKRA